MSVNKTDLVNAVTKRNGNHKYIVKSVVDDVFAELQEMLASGEKITIRGFGTFEVKQYKSHPAVHPATKESIVVPDFLNVVFSPGEELTRSVRKN